MTWAGDFPGGAGLRLLPEAFPSRDPTPVTIETPPLLCFHGDGYPAPSPVSMETGPCPSSPGSEPPSLSSDFPGSPVWELSQAGSFPSLLSGVLFVLLVCHPQTSWSCLFRTVGLCLPPTAPGQPGGAPVRFSLLTDAAKCASTGLRKPEQGLGRVLPSACLW